MRSLQARLSIGLILSLLVVILLSWFALSNAIRYIAEDYILSRLQHDNEVLLAALAFDPDKKPSLAMERISSEYQRAFSGHYYLIFANGVSLRSRSLWDSELNIPLLSAGETRQLRLDGPQQQRLIVLVNGYFKQGQNITIAIAEDLSAIEANILSLQQNFAIMAIIGLLTLVGIELLIVRKTLHPLKNASKEIRALEQGELSQLSQAVPSEILPLVDEVNHLLTILDQRLQRSRNALGNLAHALKKPLTVIQHLRCSNTEQMAQQTLQAQTQQMRQLIERELRRARIAGEGPIGAYFDPATEIKPLIDTLHKIYQQKELTIETSISTTPILPLDREDMLELLGVLMDNACKWAKTRIRLALHQEDQLLIKVEDDGDGVNDSLISQLTHRGKRLDESISGYGLGLAIAQDIVEQYHGILNLGHSDELGGFCVSVSLPIDKTRLK